MRALLTALAMTGLAASSLAPGDLDPSWGDDGVVVTPVAAYTVVSAAASAPADRTVVAGASAVSGLTTSGMLLRDKPNGALDPSFGGGDGTVADRLGDDNTWYQDLALLGDGSAIVVGRLTDPATDHQREMVARYRPDGTLDPDFGGGDGWSDFLAATCCIGGPALAVQPDGAIVVALDESSPSTVYRFTPLGELDVSWGDDGAVDVPLTARDVSAVGDRVVVVGDVPGAAALARLGHDGSLDPTFGEGGVTVVSPGGQSARFYGLAQRPGGIVATGSLQGVDHGSDAVVAAFDGDGHLDASFSGDGVATQRLGGGFDDRGTQVAVQPNGSVVASAHDGHRPNLPNTFTVRRFLPNGHPDMSFGDRGVATAPVPGGAGTPELLAVSSRGATVVGFIEGAAVSARFLLTG